MLFRSPENKIYASVSNKEDVKEFGLENRVQQFDNESTISAAANSIANSKHVNSVQSENLEKTKPFKSSLKNALKVKDVLSENRDHNNSRGGGGLLYTIIVILLVLFLLGLLFGGLGGLIYLLLVIALVLLLLKLLGIL